MPHATTRVPGVFLDLDTTVAAGRKHVVVVGHLVGDQVFGAERSLLEVLTAIDRQRYDVSCVFPSGNDAYLRAVAKHTKDITVFPYQWWSKSRPFDEQTVSRFEAIFRRGRADLVHVNTITLIDPLLAARRLDVPSIVHARELIDQDKDLARSFGEDPATILRTIRAASDFIIANSDATHRLYRKEDRSFRLYNSVGGDCFDLPNALEPGKLKVGVISSNQPKKGIESFVNLATLARCSRPELEFIVIGPLNEHTEKLEHMVRGEGLPVNLRFVDYVADPVDAMRQVNVVVSLSRFAESFGRTIAEAMAAKRPIIACRSGAAPELIRHGTDGYLIPDLDLAQALEHLGTLADHPDQVLEMGRNGRERAKQLFSPDVFASQLNSIYRQILEFWKAREPDHDHR